MKQYRNYFKLSLALIAGAALLFPHPFVKGETMNQQNQGTIFPKGTRASSEFFTGTAWVNLLLPKTDQTPYAVADVIFEPGCRNNWHLHPVRQTLFITSGEGWYQERGKPAQLLKKGDVVVIPPDVEHWHGATQESQMVHLVITDFRGNDCVKWLEPVSDAEYLPLSKAKQEEQESERIALCKKNYTTLFGGEALSGKGTDPELMNILQKFIFGEVFAAGPLDMKTREMITVVVLSTLQTLPQLKGHAAAALNVGVTPVELREAIYGCAPYIGFPRTLNALATVNEVFKERGISLPLPAQGTVTEANRHEKGLEIQNSLYGNEIREKMASLPATLKEDVPDFLTEMDFGDFYTRNGLDVKTRELLALCVLTTLGATPQITPHSLGCVQSGNSKETVIAALVQCIPYAGFPNALNAITIANQAIDESK